MRAGLEFRVKALAALVVAALVSAWYVSLDAKQPEDVSILVIGTYFFIVLCIVKLCRQVDFCGPVDRSAWRRNARMYLYAQRKFWEYRCSLGDALDFGATMLSLASCCMYVIETYYPSLSKEQGWHGVEVGISVVFLLDYLMRLVVAVDAADYLLSANGVVNVVTSLPTLIFTVEQVVSENGAYDTDNRIGSKMTYLRLLRLAKLLRVLRALHLVRGTPNDNLNRELFTLSFTVLCLVFSAAGVYQWLENDDDCFDTSIDNTFESRKFEELGCTQFHMAFYWSTIEILGRPRLVMEKDATVLMLILLTFLVCVLIPKQLANVFQVMQATNKFQRLAYTTSSRFARHLVIVGHKEFAAINMLLYEFFHPDRGDHPVQDVVLLFPTPPERDLEWLLLHPAYIGRVTYLQGTPLVEKDLERAALGTAAAVIVLANKDSDQPQWHDGELLTCIQAMKAFWLKDIVQQQRREHFTSSSDVAKKFLRPRIVTQVLLPETKEYLVELPGWTDHDVVVVASEYLAWMIGMATLARGMATLVFNLTSHTDKQRYYRTKWYPRYESGATQEIYTTILRQGNALIGVSMQEACLWLAEENCVLLGVERLPYTPGSSMDEDGFRARRADHDGLHLTPGPPDFKLAEKDRLLCICRSHVELLRVVEGFTQDYASSARKVSSVRAHRSSFLTPKDFMGSELAETLKMDLQLDQEVLQSELDVTRSISRDTHMGEQVPRGCENVRAVQVERLETQAEGLPRQSSAQSVATTSTRTPARRPSSFNQATKADVVNKLTSQLPDWTDHIVFCGLPATQAGRAGGRGLVTELIETLKCAHVVSPNQEQIVRIFVVDEDAVSRVADLCFLEPEIMEMAMGGTLRAASSDCRNRSCLINQANIADAAAVVALPEHVTKALNMQLSTVETREGKIRHRMAKQILDTNTVLTMQVVRGCASRVRENLMRSGASQRSLSQRYDSVADSTWKAKFEAKLHCVTLLLQESTSNLFFGHANMRHTGSAATSDPRWMDISPVNMSPLFASGQLLAATCFDRFAVEALFTPQVVPMVRMLLFGDRHDHRLHQIRCPKEFVENVYHEVHLHLAARGIPLLGLVRFSVDGSTVEDGEEDEYPDLPDTVLPYIITNPEGKQVILRASDLLFILSTTEVAKSFWADIANPIAEEQEASFHDDIITSKSPAVYT